MNVNISKLHSDAIIPTYAHKGDAGADLYSLNDHFLPSAQFTTVYVGGEFLTVRIPGNIVIIPTGLSIAIPNGYEGQIRSRSGLACKLGVAVVNAPGTIDAGYRGEIKIALINHGSEPHQVKTGDRIAQLVIAPVVQAIFNEVKDINDDTERGTGGFGSSGS
jgi:dUTP pyrophosphatase